MKAKKLLLSILSVIFLCGCWQNDTDASSIPQPLPASNSPIRSEAASPEPMDSIEGPGATSVESSDNSAVTAIASGELLTTDNLIDIVLSAPEGSGAIRTLTIRYRQDGELRYDTIDEISRIDLEGYDDEKKEQIFAASDRDQDGIVDIVVYREFWFPDLDLAHAEVPLWPTVYEYDLKSGIVIASARHQDYFAAYAQTVKEQLSEGSAYMSAYALLALGRLVYAAERIADGSFVPQSPYSSDNYYEDVFELTKDIGDYE